MKKLVRICMGWGLTLIMIFVLAACGPAQPSATPPTAESAVGDAAAVATVETAGNSSTETMDTSETTAVTASGEIEYIELVAGTGAKAESGTVVSVNYIGTLEDGTEFDNSYSRGEPIQFMLGQGMVIPGWEQGIAQMSVGGKARLIIPPELAYGETGAGGVIPPNATLIFEVELVDVQPAPPPPPAAPTAVDPADFATTANGVQYYDLVVGEGDTAEAGKTVSAHYTGWLEDGTMFDSSLTRGITFDFVLGAGQVIPGWDEGLMGMKAGGSRQIRIPPTLAYGDQGVPGVIPAGATLIFEVQLQKVK